MTEQNSRLNYISIPIELVACPFFTNKEKEVLAEIISISDKYLEKGGCSRTNKNLAFRHRVSTSKISNLITVANRLGFIIGRSDEVHSRKSETGRSTLYSTERKIIIRIPDEWVIMGDLYNGAFIREDIEIYKQFITIENELKKIDNIDLDQEAVRNIIFKFSSTPPTRKLLPPLPKNLPASYKSEKLYKSGLKDSYSVSGETEAPLPSENKPSSGLFQKILSAWNKMASDSGLSTIQKITPRRRTHLHARIKTFETLDDWIQLFDRVKESSFLTGDNDRGWTCCFDWLIENEDNPNKVMEGKYDDKKSKRRSRTRVGGAEVIPNKYDNIQKYRLNDDGELEEI